MELTKKIYTTREIADLLGVSRVAVFKWIKSGKLKATMVGGSYIVAAEDLPHHLLGGLSEENRGQIKAAVKEALRDYGEAFSALAAE